MGRGRLGGLVGLVPYHPVVTTVTHILYEQTVIKTFGTYQKLPGTWAISALSTEFGPFEVPATATQGG